jgi:hypothetical protein
VREGRDKESSWLQNDKAKYLFTKFQLSKILCLSLTPSELERKKVETYCDYNKNNILYIFFQTPSIDQIVQKIMMKHRGTYHTEDQMLAKILGLKQLKPAPPPQTNLTEQVSML